MKLRLEFSKIYIFLVTWQFFFFDNSRLRIYPYVFWPIMTVVAIWNIRKVRVERLHVYNLIAFAYCVVAGIVSGNAGDAFVFLAEILMYYFCMLFIGRSKESQNNMLSMMLVFSGFHLLMLFVQRLLPGAFNVISLVLRGVSGLATSAGSSSNIMVYMGLTSQSSVISLYLILGLMISLYKALSTRKRYFVGIGIAFLIGIFITNRRTNAVCGVLILFLVLLFENRNLLKKIVSAIVGVAFISVIGYRNIPGVAGLIDKFQIGITYNNLLSGRDTVWEIAISKFKTSPWFGIGYFELSNHIDLINAHNSFLQKLAELGLIGFIVFFLPFASCLIHSIQMLLFSLRRNMISTKERSIILILCAFFMYTCVISLTEGMFETPIFYIVLFMFQNYTIICKKQLRDLYCS